MIIFAKIIADSYRFVFSGDLLGGARFLSLSIN